MAENILIWIDYGFLHYGIANQLKNKNYNLFTIIDANESIKNFFKKQQIVNFKKTWYFQDYLIKEKPDLNYLTSIEQKFKISIWEIAYSDRYFYAKFNKYHKFVYDEILALIQNECKFFEQILADIKPEYVLMNTITHHYQYLFYKMCSALGIKVLTLEPTRFGNKWIILTGTIFDWKPDNISSELYDFKTYEEIQNFVESNKPAKFFIEKPKIISKQSKLEKLKAFVQFFIYPLSVNSIRYRNYGRTKQNILLKGTARLHHLKRKRRESFIDSNFITKIEKETNFVYFPLHLEPERVLLLGAPYYTDQIAVINNIAKSLPVGYKLFVKEHPAQKQEGWRESQFYEQIMNIPNAVMIHPSVSSQEIIKKSSLVISIRGTASLEATIFGKPSIVFKADIGHTLVTSIQIFQNWEELPTLIKKSLQMNCNPSDINRYFSFIKKNSFDFPNEIYSAEFSNHFNYNVGYMKEVDITEEKMKVFLEKFDELYKNLSNEYSKKMKNDEDAN